MIDCINKIYLGDCLEVLPDLPDNSIDLIVTDPPYGIGFMGKDWDKALPDKRIWSECLRVLKDGSFAFVMSIPRADCLSRMIISLEDAGFKVNFTPIFWAYASGFPKAQNIAKVVDKRVGAEREVTGKRQFPDGSYGRRTGGDFNGNPSKTIERTHITEPATPQAKALDGSYAGFQPKPAVEVTIVAMKPLSEKTFVDQALKNRKGITWLDDGRIPTAENLNGGMYSGKGKAKTVADHQWGFQKRDGQYIQPMGRFPANLLVSDDVLNDGIDRPTGGHEGYTINPWTAGGRRGEAIPVPNPIKPSSGSFSRYFDLDKWFEERIKLLPQLVQKTFPFLIVPKASRNEKEKNLNNLESRKSFTGETSSLRDHDMYSKHNFCVKCGKRHDSCKCSKPQFELRVQPNLKMKVKNFHPTVKPLKLMSYLITLGSREGDLVLDPFMGSGTTGIACKLLGRDFIGCEISKEYFEIAQKRIDSIPNKLDF